MSKVLTKGSTITCGPVPPPTTPGATPTAHGGIVEVSPAAKLTVEDDPVCLASAEGSYVITKGTCHNQAPVKPCTNVAGAAGAAAKLTVGEIPRPVLLESIDRTGATDSVPPGKVSAIAAKSKLTAT